MRNHRKREQRTVTVMVRMFCRARHAGKKTPCPECAELTRYALARIGNCRYGTDKPACLACPTHCFKPDMRARIRAVMRYAGPRMLVRHPILALHHIRDGRRGKRSPHAGVQPAKAAAGKGPTKPANSADPRTSGRTRERFDARKSSQ
ncbi:MAG: nitrous oxide-stimulated promoter family protein [Kiritimatiellaeota bacterium]|nr:nitrous oxide-stimulated promoter family protein [Kiritimatiellota bacterium]